MRCMQGRRTDIDGEGFGFILAPLLRLAGGSARQLACLAAANFSRDDDEENRLHASHHGHISSLVKSGPEAAPANEKAAGTGVCLRQGPGVYGVASLGEGHAPWGLCRALEGPPLSRAIRSRSGMGNRMPCRLGMHGGAGGRGGLERG